MVTLLAWLRRSRHAVWDAQLVQARSSRHIHQPHHTAAAASDPDNGASSWICLLGCILMQMPLCINLPSHSISRTNPLVPYL